MVRGLLETLFFLRPPLDILSVRTVWREAVSVMHCGVDFELLCAKSMRIKKRIADKTKV